MKRVLSVVCDMKDSGVFVCPEGFRSSELVLNQDPSVWRRNGVRLHTVSQSRIVK